MFLKKKIPIFRVIWIVCLFLLLIVILLMVMDYKINYQYSSHNMIYFYECSSNLCVTNIPDDDKILYSSYDCGYDDCPMYKKEIGDDYVLIGDILYNYRKGIVIGKSYDDYEFIDNRYVIVKKGDLYGIIDIDGKEIVKPIYEEIGIHGNDFLSGYQVGSIIVKKNSLYGIISYKDGKLVEEFKYKDENLEELINILKRGK